jgi:sugar fermentation stimulation protein A
MAFINITEKFETGTFLRRLNRFMTEVQLNGQKTLAHLPNSGRLLTVLIPPAKVYLQKRYRTGRKSSYDLFAVERLGVPVIVDTRFSTLAVKVAIEKRLFKPLENYRVVGENVKANQSRLDVLLKQNAHSFFLEIKSVTHVIDGVAMFPDAPTLRGRKHLRCLISLIEQGFDAGILFSVQRPDAVVLKPNYEIDREFSELLKKAVDKNVKVFTLTSIFKSSDTVELKADAPTFSFI